MFEIKFDEYKAPYEAIPLGHQGEKEARCLIWDVSSYIEEFGRGGVQVKVTQPETGIVYMATNVNLVEEEAKWTLTDVDTAKAGEGRCELYYTDQSGNVLAKSHVMRFWILPTQGDAGDTPSPYEDLIDTIAEYASTAQSASNAATASAARAESAASSAASAAEDMVDDETAARIAADTNLQTQITSLRGAVGAPTTAVLASLMSDTDKIYVYTGNESGYNYGHWYYYNGTQWADGGVYNSQALETDKTLTVSDMAADAAVVGEKIDECMVAFVTETASGSIASFDDGADDVPLKSLVVNITPKQASGTPSPTNILPITGWTAANITRAGKNLLTNLPRDIGTFSGVTVSVNAEGQIVLNGTCTSNNNARIGSCTLPAGSYTFSGMTTTGSSSTHFLNITPMWGGTSNQNLYSGEYSGTATEERTYTVRLYFRSGAVFNNTVYEPMIRLASDTDATFEPYKGNVYNISFGSAGTVYGGQLDVTSGMLTVTHKTVTINGSEQYWYSVNNNPNIYSTTFTDMASAPVHQTTDLLTNQGFTPTAYNYTTMEANTPSICARANESSIWRFYLCTEYTTLADLKAYLAANPLQVVYLLQTPVSYQLSPTEVKTLLGNNNIWSDTGSVESLEYRADTGILINKLTNAIVSLGGNV